MSYVCTCTRGVMWGYVILTWCEDIGLSDTATRRTHTTDNTHQNKKEWRGKHFFEPSTAGGVVSCDICQNPRAPSTIYMHALKYLDPATGSSKNEEANSYFSWNLGKRPAMVPAWLTACGWSGHNLGASTPALGSQQHNHGLWHLLFWWSLRSVWYTIPDILVALFSHAAFVAGAIRVALFNPVCGQGVIILTFATTSNYQIYILCKLTF